MVFPRQRAYIYPHQLKENPPLPFLITHNWWPFPKMFASGSTGDKFDWFPAVFRSPGDLYYDPHTKYFATHCQNKARWRLLNPGNWLNGVLFACIDVKPLKWPQVTFRVTLRRDLDIRSFKWYHNHIPWPQKPYKSVLFIILALLVL